MKYLIGILILCATFLFSCKKESAPQLPAYIAGDLYAEIDSNADLREVFQTFNSLGFKIETMNGFFYNVALPADSLAPLLQFLSTKPYVGFASDHKASGYYYDGEKAIRVLNRYHDMTVVNQQDLLHTVDSLHFTDRHGNTKIMLLNVPAGLEEYWAAKLRSYAFVTGAQPNYIMQFGW